MSCCNLHGIEHARRTCPICELESGIHRIEGGLRSAELTIDGLREALASTLSATQELTRLHADLVKRLLER